MEDFQNSGLRAELVRAVVDMGFKQPSEIQTQSIPVILQGNDLIGQAKTGTGKTAAFGLPMLHLLKEGRQGLVMVPTRELALQVADELKKFSRYLNRHIVALYGGASMNEQIHQLDRGWDIAVATPGRLLDHMRQGYISLEHLQFVVLDEADRMFDMGFRDDIAQIFSQVPQERQTLMFSATMPLDCQNIAKNYMRNPPMVGKSEFVAVDKIEQRFLQVPERRAKISGLVKVLRDENPSLVLIFCGTRASCDFVGKWLQHDRFPVATLHAGLRQNKREHVMDMFRDGKARILVATDVAARGIDVPGVTHVINYDVPKFEQDYIHRIGRTARAGESGKAITFLTDQDFEFLYKIEGLGIKINVQRLDIAPPPFRPMRDDSDGRDRVDRGRFGNDRRGGSGPRREGGRFGGSREVHRGPRREGGYQPRSESQSYSSSGGSSGRNGGRGGSREAPPVFLD
ncbi:DEAD/DEAH box helicase [Candidatus Woesearchaeota archaeon]|nr:DEAD/DEAH box helicase [Candidatus Woesearchaeota archaeon]